MIRFSISVAVLSSIVVASSLSIPDPVDFRIGGGRPVDVKHFANQALLLFSFVGSCGGIIFDETTIITAAHWLLLNN